MSTDDRSESLAAQAAAWVPPWERPADERPAGDGDADESPAGEPTPGEPSPGEDPSGSSDRNQPSPAAPNTAPVGGDGAADGDTQAPPTAATAAVNGDHPPARTGGFPADAVGQPADPRTPGPPEPTTSGAGDAAVATDPARVVDDHELRAALEAILLVVDEPVAEMVLAQILEQPTERVAAMLDTISAGYTAAGHGFDLRRAAGGWRLYTRPEYAAYVERFVLDGQSLRLTQAALEALAVIAYKQPVSRSRISAIRGVNCDGVMRTLVTRGLIEECGTDSESGAFLYRTTVLFLEKLGLNSVDQLPPLAPFLPDDVEEVLDAQR